MLLHIRDMEDPNNTRLSIQRLYAALVPVTSLAPPRVADLDNLNQVIREAIHVNMICESEVLVLLAQSLELVSDDDDDDEGQKRIGAIIAIIRLIVDLRSAALVMLIQDGIVGRLTAALPRISNAHRVRFVLELVQKIARSAELTAAPRHAMLAHLCAALQQEERLQLWQRQQHVDPCLFYQAFFISVSYLCKGANRDDSFSGRIDPGEPAPYAAARGLVPIARALLRRHATATLTDVMCRANVHEALWAVFACGTASSDRAARDEADCDIAEFALSADFDLTMLMLDEAGFDIFYPRVAAFDNDACARVLTEAHLAHVVAFLDTDLQWRTDWDRFVARTVAVVALVAVRAPALCVQLAVHARAFPKLLSCVIGILTRSLRFNAENGMHRDMALLLDGVMAAAAAMDAESASRVAQLLLYGDALQFCCPALLNFDTWGQDSVDRRHETSCAPTPDSAGTTKSGTFFPMTAADGDNDIDVATVVRLLRTLRLIITEMERATAAGNNSRPSQKFFASKFAFERGVEALEKLRYADCVHDPAIPAAAKELAQLRSVLLRIGVVSPADTAADEQVQRTVADVRAFAESFPGGWREALDARVASSLEACGFPRRLGNDAQSLSASASVRGNDAPPSAAALALLQARARTRIQCCARATVDARLLTADVVMKARLYNARTRMCDEYRLVIRLEDKKFPSHAAHFRVAAVRGALGHRVHRCFTSPNESSAALPFVTLYGSKLPCATADIKLPDTDIVYGEYTAASTADAGDTYPAGTVLMYPRAVAPSETVKSACDIPVFLVFKPCPTALLRGAVPVGRVVSCVPGLIAAKNGNGRAELFDATVLRCLETHCAARECQSQCQSQSRSGNKAEGTHSIIKYEALRLH